MNHELIDSTALRLRHNAAMETVHTARGVDERWELLASVLWPSRSLERASFRAAGDELERRLRRPLVAPTPAQPF